MWNLERINVLARRPGPTGTDQSADAAAAKPEGDGGGGRRLLARLITGLGAALVLLVLIAPTDAGRLTPAAFIRVPVEALLAIVLVLVVRFVRFMGSRYRGSAGPAAGW